MNINELKNRLSSGEYNFGTLVLELENNNSLLVAEQYYHKVAENGNLNIKVIEDFSEINDFDLFGENNTLYVYYTDNLENLVKKDNLIIICNKTDFESVKIPKLEDWQVVDYVATLIPGVKESDIKYFVSQYNDYLLLLEDVDKIKIFDEKDQQSVFDEMYYNNDFNSSSLTVFDLADYLMTHDNNSIAEVLKVRNKIDLQPLSVLSIVLTKTRQILELQTNPKVTLESSGCKSDKQMYYLKNNICNYFSDRDIIKIYNMLCNVEYMFKIKGLNYNYIIDYIICMILGGKNENINLW